MDELFSSLFIRAIPKVSLYLSLLIGIEILIKKKTLATISSTRSPNISIYPLFLVSRSPKIEDEACDLQSAKQDI